MVGRRKKNWWIKLWEQWNARIKKDLNRDGRYDDRPLALNSVAARILRLATTNPKTHKNGAVSSAEVDERMLENLVVQQLKNKQKTRNSNRKTKRRKI